MSKTVSSLESVVSKLEYKFGPEIGRRYILKGATDSIKVSITFKSNNRFFLKSGEKVELENFWYSKLKKESDLFLNNYFLKRDVLVVPFIGINDMANLFLTDPSFVLKRLTDFFLQDYPKFIVLNSKHSNLKFIKKIVKKSFLKLDSLSCNDFFSSKIIYTHKNEKIINLPSIKEMFILVCRDLLRLEPFKSSNIFGDLQLPNMIIDQDRLKIIDLSNMVKKGDYAYDLAKVINYLKRFHLVANYRDNNKVSSSLLMSHDKENIIFNNNLKFNNEVVIFEDKILEFFSENFNDSSLKKRVRLYSFIINSYTLKRHLQLSKSNLDLCLFCISDSFYDLYKI